ncbi:hypothetical protein RF11_06608 [Thelohanellus kitauei]|uniref:Uncharacterized protein n=1 Tax=Thelohanellus kitauei TaxID=669202 RepID=A0A0C2MJX3_THEKT|nr:hypothetical protein RF11_06608 [Thelohanellus kitauei]
MSYFHAVAIPVARSYLSEDELKEFFNTKHQTTGRPFQDDLFYEMTSRIRSGESLDDMRRNHMADIVKKVIVQNQLMGEDILDAYCRFQLACSVTGNILKLAQRCHNDLQPFSERHPDSSFESWEAGKLVNEIETRLVRSIKGVYSSGAFIGRPLLSELISAVLSHDFDRGSNLEDIIIRKIERTVFAIEVNFRRPPRNTDLIIQEEDHLFEKFVVAKWVFLCHHVNERGLWCQLQIDFIYVIVVSVIVAVFAILCLALCLMKARRAFGYQKLAEDVEASKKLPIL